jgi:hypothetical protein
MANCQNLQRRLFTVKQKRGGIVGNKWSYLCQTLKIIIIIITIAQRFKEGAVMHVWLPGTNTLLGTYDRMQTPAYTETI